MALSNGARTYQFSDGNVDAAKSLGGTILLSGTGAGLYFLDVAVTANSTTTTAPKGSIGVKKGSLCLILKLLGLHILTQRLIA